MDEMIGAMAQNNPFADFQASYADLQRAIDEQNRRTQDYLHNLNNQYRARGFTKQQNIFGALGGVPYARTKPPVLITERAKKTFALWKGTSNEGEKSAAEHALKRQGYGIKDGELIKL